MKKKVMISNKKNAKNILNLILNMFNLSKKNFYY